MSTRRKILCTDSLRAWLMHTMYTLSLYLTLEEWQWRIDEIIQGLMGVKAIDDDILVYGCGETEEEYMQDHNANIQRLLKKAQEVNLKINKH